MSDFLRDKFGLTQERLAAWLGVNRTTVALSETGQRGLPANRWMLDVRLALAAQGLVFDPAGGTLPVLPLPGPPPDPRPAAHRLATARYQALRLQRELGNMRKRAAQFEARLAALPALRAWTGEVKNPAREAGWLALFEGEAVDGLRDDCGAGPQQLLAARLGGLEREIELLEAPLPGSQVAS